MRKRFLKAFICVTAVLAIIGLVMIGAAYSGDTNTDEIPIVGTKVAEDTTTAETIVEKTETSTEMTTEETTVRVKEPETALTKPSEQTKSKEQVEIHTTTEPAPQNDTLYSALQFMRLGVIHWNGWRWTYYSEKILPGGGLDIPGRHNDADGYICDENDYICLSSSSLSRGTVTDTPFGKQGKVYDTGCPQDVIDVYVNW